MGKYLTVSDSIKLSNRRDSFPYIHTYNVNELDPKGGGSKYITGDELSKIFLRDTTYDPYYNTKKRLCDNTVVKLQEWPIIEADFYTNQQGYNTFTEVKDMWITTSERYRNIDWGEITEYSYVEDYYEGVDTVADFETDEVDDGKMCSYADTAGGVGKGYYWEIPNFYDVKNQIGTTYILFLQFSNAQSARNIWAINNNVTTVNGYGWSAYYTPANLLISRPFRYKLSETYNGSYKCFYKIDMF